MFFGCFGCASELQKENLIQYLQAEFTLQYRNTFVKKRKKNPKTLSPVTSVAASVCAN